MKFDIKHDGRTTLAVDYQGAIDLGYPVAVVGAAIKSAAFVRIADLADTCRARLASTSAGKLAEYRVKEEIAKDPSVASTDELALIDREATARGIDRAALLALITTKAQAYRQMALLVGAVEAETGASVFVLADDADGIDVTLRAVVDSAVSQMNTAFADGLALMPA